MNLIDACRYLDEPFIISKFKSVYADQVNLQDQVDRTTPLIIAMMKNYDVLARLLLDSGASIDVSDRYGNTPLSLACQRRFRSKSLAIMLIQRGAPVNTLDSTGRSPLAIACESGRVDLALLLVRRSVDYIMHHQNQLVAITGNMPIVALEISHVAAQGKCATFAFAYGTSQRRCFPSPCLECLFQYMTYGACLPQE